MIKIYAFSSCDSHPYLVNYRIQKDLYTWIDERTNLPNQWIRIPCTWIWTISSLITLVSRIWGVCDVLFSGNLKKIFLETPKNIVRVVHVPFMFFAGTVCTLVDPKFFMIYYLESTIVNLKCANEKKIGSKEHLKELWDVTTTTYDKIIDYQRQTRGF
jgi:hypothetical protein